MRLEKLVSRFNNAVHSTNDEFLIALQVCSERENDNEPSCAISSIAGENR